MPARKPKQKQPAKQNLPVVKCECGYEILLLPDLNAMDKAIEDHILKHVKEDAINEAKAEYIREDLIAQVLKKASEKKN